MRCGNRPRPDLPSLSLSLTPAASAGAPLLPLLAPLALASVAVSLHPTPAAAQEPEIVVKVGEEPTASVVPGGEITLPVVVDPSEAGGLELSEMELSVSWDPARLSFISATPSEVGSVTTDESGVADGRLAASLSSAGGPTDSLPC